jgi:hypothetical protein
MIAADRRPPPADAQKRRLPMHKRRSRRMSLLVLTYDLPPSAAISAYADRARSAWIPSVLRQPGVVELRAYRNATSTRPDAMAHVEFESVQAVEGYLGSRQYTIVISGLTAAGCTNIAAQVWNPSPVAPEPLKPPV